MNYETIIYEKDKEGIATLTFNRPQAMNAQNPQMMTEIREAVEEADKDNEVRVLIVTGAGRGFHAGDDVKALFLAEDREKRRVERGLARIRGTTNPINLIPTNKPTIAAVNGPAVGDGMAIACSCDVRIASENARFAYLFTMRGVLGPPIVWMVLKEIVGLSKAMELMLSAEFIDAAEAERIGLVNKVVPHDKLMDEAKEMAHKFLKAAPLSQQVIKQGIYKCMFDPRSVVDYFNTMLPIMFQTEDHLESSRAFVEKRAPKHKGR